MSKEEFDGQTLDLASFHGRKSLSLGSSKNCAVVIDSPEISSLHAEIILNESGVFVRDSQSRNGTFINGEPVSGLKRLRHGDTLTLWRINFRILLPMRHAAAGARLQISNLSVRADGGGKTLLSDVSFEALPGELAGIVGPSGCGKSTLLSVVSGLREPSAGKVLINFRAMSSGDLKARAALLPQFPADRGALTPFESVRFARRLAGLPAGKDDIDGILLRAGVLERRDQPLKTLSGGQRKRAALAVELASNPEIICLDEATTGLDPAGEAGMMRLFRGIASEGKTILCVTHFPERLPLCDKILALRDGKTLFFGSPAETLRFFSAPDFGSLHDALAGHSGKSFAPAAAQTDGTVISETVPSRAVRPMSPALQPAPLLVRELMVWLRSRAELAFMIFQGAAIGMIISLCFGGRPSGASLFEDAARTKTLLFALLLAAVWTGAAASAREIVKDRAVIAHEGRKGLSAVAAAIAKFAAVSLLTSAVTVLFSAFVIYWTGIQASGISLVLALVFVCVISAAAGLALSALCSTQEKALTALPVIVIGLAMLSGGVTKLSGPAELTGKTFFYSNYALELLTNSVPQNIREARVPAPPAPPGVTFPAAEKVLPDTAGTPFILGVLCAHLLAFITLSIFGVSRIIKKGS
jgi:ABC-type multidrug transport system ATPase subunit